MGEIRVRDVLESDAGAMARLLHEFNGMQRWFSDSRPFRS